MSTKSKVPWWISLSTRPMLGSIANPISPPTIVNTPMTTNSSGRDQPLRSVVWSKITASAISPVATATVDCTSWMKKLARYCIAFSTPPRRWVHASRTPLTTSPAHRRVSHHRASPHQRHPDRTDADPHDLADALIRLDRAAELVEFTSSPTTEPLYTVSPFDHTERVARMFVTHPPLAERVALLRAVADRHSPGR